MVYPTVKATVQNGKIKLLDDINLPENALLLVTIMDADSLDDLNLGERLAAGLQDILAGRFHEVSTPESLRQHLDRVFTGE